MILTHYLRKNIFRTFAVTFAIWFMLFIVQQLIIAFNKVSSGAFPTDFIVKFISYNLPSVMIYFVPFALFLGILLTFIRMYNNQEIIGMFACGIKYRTVFFSFFPLTIVVALFNLVNSLYISPTLLTKNYNQISYLRNNPTFSLLKPGSFNNVPGTNYIIFAQNISGNQAQDIYIFNINNQQEAPNNDLIYAQSAIITSDNGRRQILLINGQIVQQKLSGDLFQQLVLQLPVVARDQITQYCLVNYPQVKSQISTYAQTQAITSLAIDQSDANLSLLNNPQTSKFNEDKCRQALVQYALVNKVTSFSATATITNDTNNSGNRNTNSDNTTISNSSQNSNSSISQISKSQNSIKNQNQQTQTKAQTTNKDQVKATKTNADKSKAEYVQYLANNDEFTVGNFTFKGFTNQAITYNPKLPLPGQSFTKTRFKQAYAQAVEHGKASPQGKVLFDSEKLAHSSASQSLQLPGKLYVINFKSLSVYLNNTNLEENISRFKYQTVFQLMHSNQPNAKTEIIFRVISSLSILILAIMAFTFGKVNPRATKNGNIVVAVVLYFVYLLISQSFRGLIARNVPISHGLILYISTNVIFIVLIYLLTTENIPIKTNKWINHLRYFFGVQ